MPLEYTEADLQTIGKVQEFKNTTPAKAKEIYRKAMNRLANPDIADRAEIVLGNIMRGSTNGEKPVAEKKAKKAAKPKAAKVVKAAKEVRPDIPLPALER